MVGADKTLPLTAPKVMLVRAWLAVLVFAWSWLRETPVPDLDTRCDNTVAVYITFIQRRHH